MPVDTVHRIFTYTVTHSHIFKGVRMEKLTEHINKGTKRHKTAEPIIPGLDHIGISSAEDPTLSTYRTERPNLFHI